MGILIHDVYIKGECIAKGRPRFTKSGRAYTPQKTKQYERLVRTVIVAQRLKPLDGPLQVEITVYRKIPQSFSKKKRAEAIAGVVLPVTKPDIDNYVKSLLDASNGLLFPDDNAVVDLRARKVYAEQEGARIVVKQIKETV